MLRYIISIILFFCMWMYSTDAAPQNDRFKNDDGSWKPLYEVVRTGNESVFREALSHTSDVNAANKLGNTALHLAASKGYEKMVELLIQNKADVNKANKDGNTALHLAAFHDYDKIADLLLKNGANRHIRNRLGDTILYSAARNGSEKIVELLIQKGAYLQEGASNGDAALHFAANNDHSKVVSLLVRNGANINAVNWDGNTPLHLAANNGNEKAVKALLKNKADRTIKNYMWSKTAEELAIEKGHQKVIDLFKPISTAGKAPQNDRFKNDDGSWKPLYEVVLTGNEREVREALSHTSDVNAADIDGFTALHYAASSGNEKIVELLIQKKADVHKTNKGVETALHIAASSGTDKMVNLLLKNGADINAVTWSRDTPLHLAAFHGNEKAVKALLENNADRSIKNHIGRTARDIAIETDHQRIIDLFKTANRGDAYRACEDYMRLPQEYRTTTEITTTTTELDQVGVRIIDGLPVKREEFPWMVALGYADEENIISYECGGTIISDYFILTAAHCTPTHRKPVVARIGTTSLSNDEQKEDLRPKNRQIETCIRHPGYSSLMRAHDIALLRLSKQMEFSPTVRPACLYTDLNDVDKATNLVISGWGDVSIGRPSRSNELLKAYINTVPLSECNTTVIELNKKTNFNIFRNGVSEGKYCAHDPTSNTDSCYGDSGGPLQMYPPGSDVAKVVGVVSFGNDCASAWPGIYTRVAYYLDWIESHVWPNGVNSTFPVFNERT